jgi:hypothetical protein
MSISPSQSSVPLEQRLVRCDACGRTFVLSYRRPDASEALRNAVVTSQRVRCPLPECKHPQLVIVPIGGHEVHTLEWLGVSELPSSRHTLADVFREPRAADSVEAPQESHHRKATVGGKLATAWRSLAQRLWRSNRRDA